MNTITFYYSDGTYQVMHPSYGFFVNKEQVSSWIKGKRVNKTLTVQDKANMIASDLGAIRAVVS